MLKCHVIENSGILYTEYIQEVLKIFAFITFAACLNSIPVNCYFAIFEGTMCIENNFYAKPTYCC